MNDAPAGRRSLLLACVFASIGLVALLALGVWQLERKAEKEALIARIERQLNAPPSGLPAPKTWSSLESEHEEYRRVRFVAEFIDDEALVYTSGSAFRPDVVGAGYWVFAPVRLPDGSVVVVNRGFVPEAKKDPATRKTAQPVDPTEIVGVVRWPDRPGVFTPSDDPARNLWFTRDPEAIAAAKGWGRVAPFFVEQEGPVLAGALPQPGRLKPNLRNNHLQYAITWFGLALMLIGVLGFWLRARRAENP